ncbi:MAG: hypothetical protein EHM70_15220 [Chloroflexota bacterium]|nr:MAG: hypothetical protein EHM70_15220 [Chloroflexota bacterium]
MSALSGLKNQPAWVQSARNASMVVFPLLTIPMPVILYTLYLMDFSLAYVADVASTAMSTILRLTALWSSSPIHSPACGRRQDGD